MKTAAIILLICLPAEAQTVLQSGYFASWTLANAAAACSTVADSNTVSSGITYANVGSAAGNALLAGKFTAGSTYSCCGVQLLLAKAGSGANPIGWLTARLYNDSDGPNAILGASTAVAASTLGALTASNWVTFSFSSPVSLSVTATTWISLSNSVVDAQNFVGLFYPDDFVAGGMMDSADGGTWSAAQARRINFQTLK